MAQQKTDEKIMQDIFDLTPESEWKEGEEAQYYSRENEAKRDSLWLEEETSKVFSIMD